MLTVTNSFENKTAEAMAAISPNLITAEPNIDGVAAALGEAVGRVGDFEQRALGGDVRWSREWDDSFGDDMMARVEALLTDVFRNAQRQSCSAVRGASRLKVQTANTQIPM